MKEYLIFTKRKIRSVAEPKASHHSPFWYLKLCAPILLFPILYFPYTLWWRRAFAELAIRFAHGSGSRFLQLMITGNNTILLFWCMATVVVMLSSIVISCLRVRPWYVIPVYLAVMFSLCGILSLTFYTLIIQ